MRLDSRGGTRSPWNVVLHCSIARMLLSMGVVSETDITGTSQIVKFQFHYYFTILEGSPASFQKDGMPLDFRFPRFRLEDRSISLGTVERTAHGCAAGPEAVYSP